MIILPKSDTLASVVDTKALDLDSEEFSQICERSLTWRGKDSQSRTWLQRWKRVKWMQHLCSRTLKPSHTESFVDLWTSSLEDSRANLSALLERVKELTTPDTCSPTLPTESESANPELFSSKMLKELSQVKPKTESQFSNMYSEHWKAWVTEQRQEYSQRLKSAHLTNENGSSSLVWLTATTDSATDRSSKYAQGGMPLSLAVKNWPTPATRDHKGSYSPAALIRKDGKSRMDGLPQVVEYDKTSWPTPTVAEGSKIGNQPNYGQKGLSNHPSIVGLPDREKLNKSGKSKESLPIHIPKSRGKLNPDWVEQLMGLQVGWTQLPTEWIDSDC